MSPFLLDVLLRNATWNLQHARGGHQAGLVGVPTEVPQAGR